MHPELATGLTKNSEKLWSASEPVFRSILVHPFIEGLKNESLAENAFKFYILQDSIYLKHFGKILQKISLDSSDSVMSEVFRRHYETSLLVEKGLHESYLKSWNLSRDSLKQSPDNLSYISFLEHTSKYGTMAQRITSVLPCYWIYLEVGKHLASVVKPENRFYPWIKTYGSNENYENSVREVINIFDAMNIENREMTECINIFRTASVYEYLFWDSAYRNPML